MVVVGIGNPLRADDGAGPYLVKLLQNKVPALLIDAGSVPENYLEQILVHKPEAIVLVDAAYMGETPGTYKLIPDTLLPETSFSTHQISLKVFVALLRGMCPAPVYVLGIEPKITDFKEELSTEVRNGVERLAAEMTAPVGVSGGKGE